MAHITIPTCTPAELIEAAHCFDECIPPAMHVAIQTYLLAVLAGTSLSPADLLTLAKDFQHLSPASLLEIQTYLLCKLATDQPA